MTTVVDVRLVRRRADRVANGTLKCEPANKEASRTMNGRRLLEWHELPPWQKEDNSHVETGYRVAQPSILSCMKSWWYLHNETVNIHSHLFGALLFFVLPAILYTTLSSHCATPSVGDEVVFGIYLFGVAMCFTLSVSFHTLMMHSAWGFAFGIQLDFQGIILLMWSATAPMVYYTFYSEPVLQKVYWSLISVFAALASVITFTPAFRAPATKPLRAAVFGALALSTLAAVIHGLIVHGWDEQSRRFPMWAIGLTLLFNTLAAAAYVARFPERWWRRRFDIVGASHQIMHVCIIIAGLAWVGGMICAFENVHRDD